MMATLLGAVALVLGAFLLTLVGTLVMIVCGFYFLINLCSPTPISFWKFLSGVHSYAEGDHSNEE